MAGVLPSTAGFKRLSGNVPGSSDYACTFWAKRTNTITTDYRTYFAQFNTAYDQWAGLYSDAGNELLEFSVANGGAPSEVTAALVELNNWRPYGYVRQGTAQRMYEGGILVASATLDLSGNTVNEQWLGYDGFSIGSMVIMLFREWDTFKTLAGLIAEWNSPTVVDTVNLWSNCPFISNPNDISGNARHYTAVGAVTYATSPTAVPLTNTSSGAAFDVVGTLPIELVQVVSPDGLAASIVSPWFKRTATIADGNQLGAFSWGGQPLVTGDYISGLRVFEDGVFGSNYLGMPTSKDHPVQWPVTTGTDWYLKCEKTFDGVGPLHVPSVLYLRVEAAPVSALAARQIFVNDDTSGFPAAVLSSTVDYEVVRFLQDMPAGEAGDIASNNNYLLDDILSNDVKLFSQDGTPLATYPSWGTFGYAIRTHLATDSFYVIESRNTGANPLTLKNISNTGTLISSLTLTGLAPSTGAQEVSGIAVNPDQTILYYVKGSTAGSAVYQWSLPGNMALPDLAPLIPTLDTQDILGLPDGSILVMYHDRSTDVDVIYHYSEAGAVLHTYDVWPYVHDGYLDFIPRLAYDPDAPGTSFWVYIQKAVPELGNVKFLQIEIATGTVLTERNHASFEFGVSPNDGTYYANPPFGYFGPSESCPFFLFSSGVIPPICPGILGAPRQDGVTYTPPNFS